MAGGQFHFDGRIYISTGLTSSFSRNVATLDPGWDLSGGGPQPPEQTGPDELLTITGFGLTGSFTLLMAGMMPEDDWHHLTPRTGSPRYWPLFTLWADSSNWIEFGAVTSGDTSNISGTTQGSFRLRCKANGNAPVDTDWPLETAGSHADLYWSRNSQLLVGISFTAPVPPGTTGTLIMVASLGGEGPRIQSTSGTTVAFGSGFNFSTIKFRGNEDRVVSFRWFGGQAVDGTAMSIEDVVTQFRTLGFLL